MKMYLFPHYVSLRSTKDYSPRFLQLLKDREVELSAERWDGNVDSIPEDEPAIIRASSVMMCSRSTLAEKCAEVGHLVFYDDRLVRSDGTFGSFQELEAATVDFLSRK